MGPHSTLMALIMHNMGAENGSHWLLNTLTVPLTFSDFHGGFFCLERSSNTRFCFHSRLASAYPHSVNKRHRKEANGISRLFTFGQVIRGLCQVIWGLILWRDAAPDQGAMDMVPWIFAHLKSHFNNKNKTKKTWFVVLRTDVKKKNLNWTSQSKKW